MTPRRRWRGLGGRAVTLACLALLALASRAQGQEGRQQGARDTARAPADTTPGDTVPAARPDTLEGAGRDTAAADTARAADLERMQEGLAGGSFPQRDSLFRELASRSGFRVIEYRGRRVEMQVESRRILLRDTAQVNYGDAALEADSIAYLARPRFLSARGKIRMVSPNRRQMSSDSVLYYDVSRRKGTVLDARTHFSQRGAEWQVRGDAVPVGRDTVFVTHGSFSSCQLEDPHYYFQAGQIKMVTENVIVAWPVVLYIARVPVFWLPFFAQDIRPERRSGIVPPRFGFNDIVRTSEGLNRNISDFGYYWAINEFMDARATADWFSGNYTRLNGTFRYRFRKDFIDGSVNVSRDWGAEGRPDNWSLGFNHNQELSPHTTVRASGRYVQSTQTLQDRAIDPETETQTIDSDVGLRHRFPFADLSLSARRRQFLSASDQTDLTLPNLRLSFSPVTFNEAPPGRAGFFNNLTWNGSMNLTRADRSRETSTDRTQTNGSVNQSLRLGGFNISSSANVQHLEETPVALQVDSTGTGEGATVDSAFVDLDASNRTTVNWSAGTDYQIDLMGSTTLRPNVNVRGTWFRSSVPGDSVRDTDGSFLAGPTRASFGATLSTDLFGFFPGFGPFSRIRHKISPRFRWRFSPEVSVPADRVEIPNFPGATGRAENQLTVTFNQTIEAKMPMETDRPSPQDTAAREGGGQEPSGPVDGRGAEAAGAGPGEGADAEAPGAAGRDGPPAGTSQGPAGEERKVTLLAIRSDALVFDFERAKEGEPALVTDRWGSSFTSDLLRGLSMNIDFDLFEGSGPDRDFEPFLAEVNASFSLRSGQGVEDIIGLGGPGGGGAPGTSFPAGDGGPPSPGPGSGEEGEEETGGGPWNLNLQYSLSRSRTETTFTQGQESQSLSGTLSFNPTPNWQVTWSTSYDLTDSQFGSQRISLVRQLHRWRATFDFSKTFSGNFAFQVRVLLTDAPDLKVDYNQRSEPR